MANENKNSLLDIVKILKAKKQIILQGAPGTGKTYTTAEVAVQLCDDKLPDSGLRDDVMKRYRELTDEGRIGFTTFHQSIDYEQFVEGIVPVVDKEKVTMTYEVRDGIFKKMARLAANKALPSNDGSYKIDENLAKEAYYSILTRTNNGDIDWGERDAKVDNGNIKFVRNDGELGDATTLDRVITILRKTPDKSSLKQNESALARSNGISGNNANHAKVISEMFKLHDSYIKHEKPFVLIIDEINRGNISKILGELITLLEVDKRQGMTNEVKATLPYSQEEFSVPQNLYIIGTMNTADRSVGYIDYAVRRRFAFYTIKADEEVIRN